MSLPADEPVMLDVSPDLFEELYEHAPCGYLSTDADGRIVRANQTFAAWIGRSRDALLGTSLPELLAVGSQLFYETRYQPVLQLQGEVREAAFTFLHADGTALSALVNSTKVEAANDRAAEIRIAVFDSTQRRDYERELLNARRAAELSETRVRVLQEASRAFGASATEEVLALALADTMRRAFSATTSAVLILDAEGSLELVAGTYPLHGILPTDDRTPELVAVGDAQLVLIAQRSADSFAALDEAMLSARVGALCAAPLVVDGLAVGAVITTFARPRDFDPDFIELQETLARQAAQTLSRLRLQRELVRLALYDPLTGLASRVLVERSLEHAFASSRRNGRGVALMLVDLDGFKAVNDELGHSTGDAVLKEVATRLSEIVREDDVVGRFGGDEFLVVCQDVDESAAMLVAGRIVEAMHPDFDSLASGIRLTVSVGVGYYLPTNGPAPTSETLFRVADAAMYASKDAGKDRVTIERL
ncbi:MAG: hypothetical protein JWR53_307 [Glaciihabitans sp.]|jgi:diguanylate cyclase (GGDEF)-like protein/PAS domain S-box-containing protein|nr:hypothetical protein [Glaciihabitans sp.]